MGAQTRSILPIYTRTPYTEYVTADVLFVFVCKMRRQFAFFCNRIVSWLKKAGKRLKNHLFPVSYHPKIFRVPRSPSP